MMPPEPSCCAAGGEQSRAVGTDLLCAEPRSLPAPDGGASSPPPPPERRAGSEAVRPGGSPWRLLGAGRGRREAHKGPLILCRGTAQRVSCQEWVEVRLRWGRRSLYFETLQWKILRNIYLPCPFFLHKACGAIEKPPHLWLSGRHVSRLTEGAAVYYREVK